MAKKPKITEEEIKRRVARHKKEMDWFSKFLYYTGCFRLKTKLDGKWNTPKIRWNFKAWNPILWFIIFIGALSAGLVEFVKCISNSIKDINDKERWFMLGK